MIVLEDLAYIREELDYGKFMNRRLHAWAFARLQGRIADKAAEAGIPVQYVRPEYTSQTCHACKHVGSREGQATFRCTSDGCWVSEYQADLNAAANIAGRLDPWGESLPVKWAGDDSPGDGSSRDRAARQSQDDGAKGVASPTPARGGADDNAESSTPAEGAAGTTQMTLREAVSEPTADDSSAFPS